MSREAMKQALDALGYVMSHGAQVQIAKDILTQAIEQAEKQGPVAWASSLDFDDDDQEIIPAKDKGKLGTGNCNIPLYAAPPKRELVCVCGAAWEGEEMVHAPRKRERVGLTDEEVAEVISGQFAERNYWVKIAKALEAKLKEKNHG